MAKKKEVESAGMNSKEFKNALTLLVKEKGIDEDIIYEAMESGLISGYKRNYSGGANVRIGIDRDTGEFHVYSFKTVVLDEEHEKTLDEDEIVIDENFDQLDPQERLELVKPFIFNPKIHITLEEASKIVPGISLGETIEEEVTPKDFGRVAAATAKQVVIQKIREAERTGIMDEYGDKEGEMVSGIVAMEDVRNYYIDLGKTQAILPKTEIIPGEVIEMNSHIKVYISKVDKNPKGPLILLSRSHYGFVKRLFELEIPEVNEGIILIYSVAREAGNRTKVAVYSEVSNVDPVGSCIGEKGSRINRIIKELKGEKIDIIPYDKDEAKFIENALSPAKNLHVFVADPKNQEALVVVNDDNLSLAIGRKGLNVKLAARLTHFKLDIKTLEQAKEMGINIVE